MQTNILSTQSTANGANAVPRKESASSAPHGDAGQFGAMLSSEMMQRQMPMPAPAPAAPTPGAPNPQAADKPAQLDEAPAPQHAAQPNQTQAKAADKNQAADGDEDAEDSADAEAAAKADPAAEMLALMASLKNPAQDAASAKGAKSAAGQAFDALGGGKAKRSDAQLAALQAAMKSVSKDGAAEAAGKTFSAAGVTNPALAAAGADLATDTRQAADNGADLRTMLAAMGKGEARPQLDAADLALQQAREAALQATTQANALPAAAALAQAQPAVLEAQAAAAADMLSARVGSDQWENQVGQKIVYMVGSEEQTANLTLNPPDLGPMQVVLSITNDQASVTFSSNQLEVRQALENALPRLREMMSESGIALGNASVNAGMPDGRQAQDQPARSSDGFGRSGRRGDDGAVGGVAEAARPVTRSAILGDRGMVDTFA